MGFDGSPSWYLTFYLNLSGRGVVLSFVDVSVAGTELPEEPKLSKQKIVLAFFGSLAQTLRGYFFSVRPLFEAAPILEYL